MKVGPVKLGILLCGPAFVFLDGSLEHELFFQPTTLFVL